MSFWAPPPEPATKLGRHRQLCPSAGIHVSPIALGAMNIGDKWSDMGMGAMDKEGSFKLLDAYYEAGGNFIDTANNYQDESSEEFIGEWMEKRGIRDQMVIATKYTTNFKRGATNIPQKTHYVGNNIKAMHISVEASLKKLRTEYIDILYVHWWDYTTSVEEMMNGLHHLVAQGKGVSVTPSWIVTEANNYARMSGKTPFVIYQGPWSILRREFERDIIPMARHEGMALAPWSVLGSGKIRTDAEEEKRRETGEKGAVVVPSQNKNKNNIKGKGRTISGQEWERTEDERKICQALEKVAAEVCANSIGAVAIAYVLQKAPYVFPVIGGRKVEHLHANIEALNITLSPEQISYLEGILHFDIGFPFNVFGDGSDYNWVQKSAGHFDKWPVASAIRPSLN